MFRVFTECSECSSRRAYGGGCRPHTPAVPLRGASLPPSVIGVMRGVGGNAREFLGEHCSKCSPSVQSVHGLPTTTSSTGVRATIHLEICDVGSNCCCGAQQKKGFSPGACRACMVVVHRSALHAALGWDNSCSVLAGWRRSQISTQRCRWCSESVMAGAGAGPGALLGSVASKDIAGVRGCGAGGLWSMRGGKSRQRGRRCGHGRTKEAL